MYWRSSGSDDLQCKSAESKRRFAHTRRGVEASVPCQTGRGCQRRPAQPPPSASTALRPADSPPRAAPSSAGIGRSPCPRPTSTARACVFVGATRDVRFTPRLPHAVLTRRGMRRKTLHTPPAQVCTAPSRLPARGSLHGGGVQCCPDLRVGNGVPIAPRI